VRRERAHPSGQAFGLDELARYATTLAQKAGRLVVLTDTGRGEGLPPAAGLTGRFVAAPAAATPHGRCRPATTCW
jgi:hypothetical protein